MQVKTMIPVSVYIITLNEASKIHSLLVQLENFEEVIIVDSGSTDATAYIARKFPNVKFSHRSWTGYCDQKTHAKSLCKNEWVLSLDADEELTDDFMQELRETIEQDDCVALESRRILYRWGRQPNAFTRDDRLIRLFKKECGFYKPCRVHERVSISGPVKHTDAFIYHHENLTFGERVQKSNKYSTLKALDKHEKGARCNIFTLILIFPWSFIQCYLFKGYFLDGCGGMLTSMNTAYYNFMKYAKLWELEHLARAEIKRFHKVAKANHNYLP